MILTLFTTLAKGVREGINMIHQFPGHQSNDNIIIRLKKEIEKANRSKLNRKLNKGKQRC